MSESEDPIEELNRIFENMRLGFTRQWEMNKMLMAALIEVDEEILKPLETAGLDDLPILRAAATKLDVRLQEIIDDPMWNV